MQIPHNQPFISPGDHSLTRNQVVDILQRISSLRVGVVGDACLDIYWHADMTISELSRETPHYNLPITQEEHSPGAAGNVAVNFTKLNCAKVSICSVFGNDWRGNLLMDKFSEHNVDYSYSQRDQHRYTPTYCKTIRHGLQGVRQEDSRHDFVNRTELSEASTLQLLEDLDRMAAHVDVIGVIDQVDNGVVNAAVLERLQYWSAQGKLIVVDSRNRISLFRGLIVKPNEVEVLRSINKNSILLQESQHEMVRAGLQLSDQVGKPCCITLGDKGAMWIENQLCTFVPTEAVAPPIDITGAGDSFNAALISALGAGCSGTMAVAFSHLAAAVSIRKLDGVGTASPKQILDRYDELN
ncbi:PfkB family carbohydrate kinase [Paenibacillus sp. LjRoot153]|uniref:bifunctional heptose 7-phosphate kinase/heptose 1-phosphate adenyltransferase n=1 Tax=Paenibacillus sp. LjRoot153 TaxID=3342270 RepID=UPI003ECD65CD